MSTLVFSYAVFVIATGLIYFGVIIFYAVANRKTKEINKPDLQENDAEDFIRWSLVKYPKATIIVPPGIISDIYKSKTLRVINHPEI